MRRSVVVTLILIIGLIPSLVSCTLPTPTGTAVATQTQEGEQGTNGACGRERWSVKTMSDPQASQVDLTPIDTTVQDLTKMRAPKTLPDNGRVVPTEFTTYRVTARLLKAKIEDDKDIHLVIADPKNTKITMIVELPNPTCSGAANSRVLQQLTTARQQFVGKFGTPPNQPLRDDIGHGPNHRHCLLRFLTRSDRCGAERHRASSSDRSARSRRRLTHGPQRPKAHDITPAPGLQVHLCLDRAGPSIHLPN